MSGSRPDYYMLLGVEPDADGEAIRAAYRALAKQHHPDLSDADAELATERFMRIQEAYEVLGDPEKRAQYDLERLRRAAALEHAAQLQREFDELQAKAGPQPPPGPPPQPGVLTKNRVFFGTAVLLVAGALGFVAYQQRQRSLQDQITVVRVDPPRTQAEATKPSSGVPPDLGVLAKEMERLSRAQVERVEAARKKMEAEIENAERQYAAATAKRQQPPATVERPAKVECSGEGRRFSLHRQNEAVSVAFNDAAPTQPTVHDLGTGIVMVSAFEPTKRIALGFIKGDKNGTIVLIYDAAGNVFRTFGVECTAAAF